MPADNIGWIKHRGGVSHVSRPEEPATTLWLLFVIKQYVLSACKVQSTVLGAIRHTGSRRFQKERTSLSQNNSEPILTSIIRVFFFF